MIKLLLGFILAWLPVKQYYSEWIIMDKKVKVKMKMKWGIRNTFSFHFIL